MLKLLSVFHLYLRLCVRRFVAVSVNILEGEGRWVGASCWGGAPQDGQTSLANCKAAVGMAAEHDVSVSGLLLANTGPASTRSSLDQCVGDKWTSLMNVSVKCSRSLGCCGYEGLRAVTMNNLLDQRNKRRYLLAGGGAGVEDPPGDNERWGRCTAWYCVVASTYPTLIKWPQYTFLDIGLGQNLCKCYGVEEQAGILRACPAVVTPSPGPGRPSHTYQPHWPPPGRTPRIYKRKVKVLDVNELNNKEGLIVVPRSGRSWRGVGCITKTGDWQDVGC